MNIGILETTEEHDAARSDVEEVPRRVIFFEAQDQQGYMPEVQIKISTAQVLTLVARLQAIDRREENNVDHQRIMLVDIKKNRIRLPNENLLMVSGQALTARANPTSERH